MLYFYFTKKHLFFITLILVLFSFKINAQTKVCTSTNPNLITPKHWNGSRASNGAEQAIVLFGNNTRGTGQTLTTVATYAQVGTTWGTAFRHTDKKLYASAMVKRHGDISPNGLGSIYEINMTTPTTPGTPTLWLDINAATFVNTSNVAVNLGFPADPGIATRELAGKGTQGHDVWAYDKVGRQGIGDIEFSEDLTQLYVMDLTNRQLLIIDYATKKLVTKIAIPNPGCSQAGDRRPWAIKAYNGNVYIGIVCSGETNRVTSDVNLFIMKLDNITAPTAFTAVINTGGVPAKDYVGWKYWSNLPSDINSSVESWTSPLISDIEFDAAGNMLLGVMDRSGHQHGSHNYPPIAGQNYDYLWFAYGDILKATKSGATWTFNTNYQKFYNLVSGSSAPADDQFAGGMQVNNCTGTEYMIANTIDPINVESNGTSWDKTSDGQKQTGAASTSSLEIHPYQWGFGQNLPFGKANGLGDLEVLMTFNCPTITSPSATQTACVGTTGSSITAQTNQNAANSIKFVKFTTDQSATNGSETATELANIYAGTSSIATVTPTGGASPYTATYTWNAADFPNATTAPITYYVYAVLNPDLGASCRPVQEIKIVVNPKPSVPSTFGIAGTCTGTTANNDARVNFTGVTNANKAGVFEGAAYAGNPYSSATGTVTGGAVNFTGLKHNTTYTFRFFNGDNICFTDVNITTPNKTCVVGTGACYCSDYIYMNDTNNDVNGYVHKFRVNADGSLTEIPNGITGTMPWFAPGAGLPSPHGLGQDLNGNLYIGETNTGKIRKLNCDGVITPTATYSINDGGFNIASKDGIVYMNSKNSDQIRAYDICTGAPLGYIKLGQFVGDDWGFHIGADGTFYSTNSSFGGGAASVENIYKYKPTALDFTNHTVYNPLTTNTLSYPPGLHVLATWGITSDPMGNFYVVMEDDNFDNTTYDTWILKYDSNGNRIAQYRRPWGFTNNNIERARGLVYLNGTLYVSGGPYADCVAMVDAATMTYKGTAAANMPGQNPKGIALVRECCTNLASSVRDTTLCNAPISTKIFLQTLIGNNCTGPVCGNWAVTSATGMTFNACDNSITVNANNGCGKFVLSGGGGNAQCSAFNLEINITVNNITAAIIQGNQSVCTGSAATNLSASTVATGGGTVTYQWQKSTTSCTTGFTDIVGQTTTTLSPGIITATTYYQLIAKSSTACTNGLPCSSPSNCVTINVNPLPTFTLSQTNVTCFGSGNGTINITTTSGTTPFTYSKDDGATFPSSINSFNNLPPNVYKIAVKDANGCVKKCN